MVAAGVDGQQERRLAIGWHDEIDGDDPYKFALDASEDPEDRDLAAQLQVARIWQ